MILRTVLPLLLLLSLTATAQAQLIKLTVSGTLQSTNFDASDAFEDIGGIGDAFRLVVRWDDSIAPSSTFSGDTWAGADWGDMGSASLFLNGNAFHVGASPTSFGFSGFYADEDGPLLEVYNEHYDTTEHDDNPGSARSTLGDRVTHIGVRFEMFNRAVTSLPDAGAVDLASAVQDLVDFATNGPLTGFRGRFEIEDDDNRDDFELTLDARHVPDLRFSVEVPAPGGLAAFGLAAMGLGFGTRTRARSNRG